MRHPLFPTLAILLSLPCSQVLADDAPPPVTFADDRLGNGIIAVTFDFETGGFSISDAATGDALLSEARFGLPSGEAPGEVKVLGTEDVRDPLGSGKRLLVEVQDSNLLRYSSVKHGSADPARQLFSYTLYEGSPALVFGFGLRTHHYISMRLMGARPLAGGRLFGGRELKNPLTLNGGAGGDTTTVKPGLSRICANSLMLTALVDNQRRTAVWGGLGHADFGKFASLRDGSPALFAEDPVGRLVDEGETYLPADTFYLDVHTREPFDALERYGRAMRQANQAAPNVYDFPVLCGWSTGVLSKLPRVNDSASLIGELKHANDCGLTKYTKVSLRLEPDKYHFDTEQGWWDDARMRKFGHLTRPTNPSRSGARR
jgi:hypothetical protein